jgi:hypothetical protein
MMRRVCRGQTEPISLEEALGRDTRGKALVHVSSTLRQALDWFEMTIPILVAQRRVSRVMDRRAVLTQGGEIVSAIDYQVAAYVLCGLEVIWVV